MKNQQPLAGLDPADLLRQGAAEDTFVDGTPTAFTVPPLEEIAAEFPQYEILELIGRGGMGAVYKVRQKALERFVALKILPPGIGQSPDFSERFAREAKALAKLNHPGIVTLHEFGQQDGLCFILMEFVDGVNLAQLMRTGRISPREALAIVPQVCDALQYAHDQGIVHRDIKPENILLDRSGRVKVADFGIAKVVAAVCDPIRSGDTPVPENQTLAGKIIGTPQYMAPEQIEHPSDVDHRADIYALGVILYQMLTGELPGQSLEPPSRKVHIDVRLDEVVLRALESDPERRYQQASQVREIVDTIILSPYNNQREEIPVMDIKFNCPKCDQKIAVDPSAAGAELDCPSCAQTLVVPGGHAAEPTPTSAPQIPAPPRHALSPPLIEPQRAKGLAIWALVLGIIGIIPIVGLATGLIGLALGITALVKKTKSKGLAVAGTILGALAALMIPIHLIILTASMTGMKFGAKTVVCTSNLKTIGVAIASYQQKNDGKYPESLNVLVKEGLIAAKVLQCPLHDDKSGQISFEYIRPSGPDAQGIIAWDRYPHKANKVVVGRNVLYSDLSVRFLNEQMFSQTPKVARQSNKPARPPAPPSPSHANGETRTTNTFRPEPQPQPAPVEAMTISSAISALQSVTGREQRVPLRFLAEAPVTPEVRAEVIAAVHPLLNDVDSGPMAFDVFALWADKEQVPDLIEMLRIAPTSQRGIKCMNLLSRMGDARAAEPLAECLTQFHILRHVQAALAALGEIAKPAVLPYYHHEDGNARKAARELLRGYKATEEEIFAETIKTLESGSLGARHSALFDLPKAKLTPEQQVAAARAMRPLVSDADDHLRKAAHHAMKTLATSADADFLLDQMSSTDDATRQFATDLLVRMKDARAAKPLAAMLGDSKRTYAAGRSLVSLGSAAEPAVIPYLRSDDPATRKRAAEILGDIGTSASLSALQALEKDKDFFTKSSAVRAVGAIKSRSSGTNGKR